MALETSGRLIVSDDTWDILSKNKNLYAKEEQSKFEHVAYLCWTYSRSLEENGEKNVW